MCSIKSGKTYGGYVIAPQKQRSSERASRRRSSRWRRSRARRRIAIRRCELFFIRMYVYMYIFMRSASRPASRTVLQVGPEADYLWELEQGCTPGQLVRAMQLRPRQGLYLSSLLNTSRRRQGLYLKKRSTRTRSRLASRLSSRRRRRRRRRRRLLLLISWSRSPTPQEA